MIIFIDQASVVDECYIMSPGPPGRPNIGPASNIIFAIDPFLNSAKHILVHFT